MKVYRVWAKDVTDCAWLKAGSEANAIDVVSTLKLFTGPLKATVDDKKFDVPKGVVLSSTGKTFAIAQS